MGTRSILSKETDVVSLVEVYDQGIVELEKCIQELHNIAMTTADRYWDFVNAHEDRSTDWDSKSSLQLSCYRRGNHIEIKWTAIKWYGSKGKRTSLRTPITKNPDTFAYHETKLKVHAKDWEFDMVKETELKMQLILRRAHHVVRGIMSLRNAKQVNRVTPIDGSPADLSDEPETDGND